MRWTLVLLGSGALAFSACSARVRVPVGIDTGVVEAEGGRDEGTDRVWVCHRSRWQEVAAPAADAHSRHGDRVSRTTQEARASC